MRRRRTKKGPWRRKGEGEGGDESRYKKRAKERYAEEGDHRRMCGQVGEPQTDECAKVGFSRMRLMGNRKQTDAPPR